eukprot:15448288-Heterocapsa_arctica.AAC.1
MELRRAATLNRTASTASSSSMHGTPVPERPLRQMPDSEVESPSDRTAPAILLAATSSLSD